MQDSSSANATATENTQLFPIVPATFGDAEDWIGEPDGTWLSTSGTTCPPSVVEDKTQSFHAETQLKEGFGLILDIGSIGNLGGDAFALNVATSALKNGRKPEQVKRERPLRVSGVGHGSDVATHNVSLPIVVQSINGECSSGTFDMPTVKNSNLPGLLGLTSLTNRRSVIDCTTKTLYFLGPDDYDLSTSMPAGTQTFQLVSAPSGHLVLPITKYSTLDLQQKHGNLTLDPVTVALHVSRSRSHPSPSTRSVSPTVPWTDEEAMLKEGRRLDEIELRTLTAKMNKQQLK
jgi:hypothetical protein